MNWFTYMERLLDLGLGNICRDVALESIRRPALGLQPVAWASKVQGKLTKELIIGWFLHTYFSRCHSFSCHMQSFNLWRGFHVAATCLFKHECLSECRNLVKDSTCSSIRKLNLCLLSGENRVAVGLLVIFHIAQMDFVLCCAITNNRSQTNR